MAQRRPGRKTSLRRPREECDSAQVVALVIGGSGPLSDLHEGALHLIDAGTMAGPRHTSVFVLASHVPGAESELEPPVGELVRGR
jgi:hypothetical protein